VLLCGCFIEVTTLSHNVAALLRSLGHNPFTQIPGGGGGGRPEGNALFRSPQPFQLKIKKE